MGNVLITADIHLADYNNYNYSVKSRLDQFDLLADRLIEIGKENNCTEVWILGDLIDKPNSRPYVIHRMVRFIDKLCKAFEYVRYTLGNHDLDSKSQLLGTDDSVVTAFDGYLFNYNFVYMDKKILEVNGHKYGFMNWRPNQDLTWLGDQHLDILFGHYTKSNLFGQEIDESKFDLMIHGDIHNSQVIGKFVSVCNPIQKDMSSEAEGKVIIFDTETMEWKRELTDPDHTRFLQMKYVNLPELEGFESPLQYNIYKPTVTYVNNEELQKSVTWTEVEDLVVKTCQVNGLEDIHSFVSSNCGTFEEIDFNFQLTYLKVHGYRSISDFEMEFSQGDIIALLGKNGSGKSSIIKALKGAFMKNSELKYEQSLNTVDGDVQIIVRLLYQNKLYEIKKGNQWGLTIDGQEQAYHGIRDFESDLICKLPFLNYLDLFFLSSNISNLSNQFNSLRRIELISKFYRLDRINAYYTTAFSEYNKLAQQESDINSEISKEQGKINYIQTAIDELSKYDGKDKEEYKSKLAELKLAREKFTEYKIHKESIIHLENEISSSKDKIRQYETRVSFDYETGLSDLSGLKSKLNSINEAYEATYKKSIEFESLLKDIQKIEDEGSSLAAEVESLKAGKCPTCNSLLDADKVEKLKSEYNSKLDALRSTWSELDSKFEAHVRGRDSKEYYVKILNELKSAHKEVSDNIELLNNKIVNYEKSKSLLDSEKSHLKELEDKLQLKLSAGIEEVKLPIDINDLEIQLNSDINNIDSYEKYKSDLQSALEDVSRLNDTCKELQDKIERYNRYINLTSLTGVIIEEILKKLADKFTTSGFKYEVEAGVYRGSRYINFNSYYLSVGKWMPYERCSDGQKNICDLDFLEKLFSVRIGLITLDEYLKHLDDDNFSIACDILGRMNANTILLSTHDANLTVYSKRLLLELNSSGETVFHQV